MADCVFDVESYSCVACGAPLFSPDIRRNCVTVGRESKDLWPQTLPVLLDHGPGTELSRLLKRYGIEPTPTCACRAKAAQMDAWGCDECERPERIDEVVAVMRAEAAARGLPFVDIAGRVLVRRAIANARREEARRASQEAREVDPPAV